MHEYDWAGGQVMLKFKGQNYAVKLGESGGLAQGFCESLQAPAFDSKRFSSLVALETSVGYDGATLQQWNAGSDKSQANKDATEKVFRFHAARLLQEIIEGEHDFSI